LKLSFHHIYDRMLTVRRPALKPKGHTHRPWPHLVDLSRCKLTARSRVFKELIVAHIVKNFNSLYRTQRSISPCPQDPATELSFILRQLNPIHTLADSSFRIHFNKILMLSSHPRPDPLHRLFHTCCVLCPFYHSSIGVMSKRCDEVY
jgi:hypothetical protein